MPNIHIVTDSGARFSNPRLVRRMPVTILPNTIAMDDQLLREDIDIDIESAFARIGELDKPPVVMPPSERDYAELFLRLAPRCDAIISVHPSRKLSESWQNGRLAAQAVSGDCEIAIIDSQSLCAGQGMLIRVAARAAEEAADVEAAIYEVRQAVERIYSVYCVRDPRFLRAHGIMSASHAILAAQLGVMPIVSLEDGELIVIEKSKSEFETIERMVEFLAEFDELEDALALQDQREITSLTRDMHELLAEEFPGRHFPFAMYSASMACWLGAAAAGVAVLEKAVENDFAF